MKVSTRLRTALASGAIFAATVALGVPPQPEKVPVKKLHPAVESAAASPSPSKIEGVALPVISKFGSIAELTAGHNPWRGFDDQAPVLISYRAQKVAVPAGQEFAGACLGWIQSLVDDAQGVAVGQGNWENVWKEWQPWSEDDRGRVTGCDDFPCGVKLDRKETQAMKSVPESQRMAKFQELVKARADLYVKSGDRPRFEYGSDRVDPLKLLEKAGLKSALSRPGKTVLRARKIQSANLDSRVLRQIVDRRSAQSSQEGTVWMQDVYTTHFFESWGEWGDVRCDASTRTIWVTMGILFEFDLFKEADLFTRLAFPKMKTTAKNEGAQVLEQWFTRLQKQHEK